MSSVPEKLVAARVVRNDGRTPFVRPQKGVAPVEADDFVTRGWALANLGGGGVSDGNKGDITVSGSGATWALNANAVSDAKLRDSAGLSVVGRAADSVGDPGDITAGTDGFVLRRSGTSLSFGTVATAGLADDVVTDAKMRNSAALSVVGRSANSTGDPADIAAGTDGHVLRRSGTSLGFGTIATAGIANAAVTDAKLRNSAALSVIGRVANSSGAPADIAAAIDGQVLRRSGTSLGFGALAAGAFADGTISLARLVNQSRDTILGRTGASGAPTALVHNTPGRVDFDAGAAGDTTFWYFDAATGVLQRASMQSLFDAIGAYFGISPP